MAPDFVVVDKMIDSQMELDELVVEETKMRCQFQNVSWQNCNWHNDF
jgi:hypothetical protein